MKRRRNIPSSLILFGLWALAGHNAFAAWKLLVIEGEGAIANVRSRVSREFVVQLNDEHGRPLAGVPIEFILPDRGPSGLFRNGKTSTVVASDAQGRAAVSGVQWGNVTGRATVSVVARRNGEEAKASFTVFVVTAAAAASDQRDLQLEDERERERAEREREQMRPRPSPRPEPAPPPKAVEPAPRIPKFPWPPPDASAREVLSRQILERDGTLKALKDVDRVLSEALDRCGYSSKSYYAVPHGFALATQMERILRDGSPASVDRFDVTSRALPRFSLSAYLRALFTARPGFFRVIVFIVTDQTMVGSGATIGRDEAIAWVSAGAASLPASIGNLPFGPDTVSTALIYEFEREDRAAAKPFLKTPSPIPARDHLERAGILKALQGGQ